MTLTRVNRPGLTETLVSLQDRLSLTVTPEYLDRQGVVRRGRIPIDEAQAAAPAPLVRTSRESSVLMAPP